MHDVAVKTPRATPLIPAVVAVGLVAVVIAGLAFLAGSNHRNNVHVLTGRAYVGSQQATVQVAGRGYGIPADIEWVDASGVEHDGGWPACLGGPGHTVTVRFGEMTVTGPVNDSWPQVVWVDCRR